MFLHLICSYGVDVREALMRNNDIFKYLVVPASLFFSFKVIPKEKELAAAKHHLSLLESVAPC